MFLFACVDAMVDINDPKVAPTRIPRDNYAQWRMVP